MDEIDTAIRERFRMWINARYEEWRTANGGVGREVSVSRFAAYVGVEQTLMRSWLRGAKMPQEHQTVSKLVSKYGLEPLVILEYILPSDVKDPLTRQLLDNLGVFRLEE